MYTKLFAIIGLLVLLVGESFGQTDTPTETPTNTPTVTQTPTITLTPTVTNTRTRTVTRTFTPLPVDTNTATRTVTRTSTTAPTAANTSTSTVTPANTGTRTATATFTPIQHLIAGSNAGCMILSNTPQAVGNPGRRRGFAFWTNGGEAWCGYESSLVSRTPGPRSGAHYSDGQGLSRCECQDADLYCIGDNTVQVCWDQCAEQTPTVTATATPTNTPS